MSQGLAPSPQYAVKNVQGQEVRDLGSKAFGHGSHSRSWDARDNNGHAVAAGLYFLNFEIPTRTVTKRLVALH